MSKTIRWNKLFQCCADYFNEYFVSQTSVLCRLGTAVVVRNSLIANRVAYFHEPRTITVQVKKKIMVITLE